MTRISEHNAAFAESLLSGTETGYSFKPSAFHNVEGDCIEIHLSDEPFTGKRLSKAITVFIGEDSGRPVGLVLKGVRSMFDDVKQSLPGLYIEVVENKRVRIEYLIKLVQWRRRFDGEGQAVFEVLESIVEMADKESLSVEFGSYDFA